GTVCVVGKMRDLILQLSKSSIYSTKPHIIKKIKKLMPCGGYVTNHGERVSLATYVTSPNKLEDVDFNHGRIPLSLNEL
ncbi:hypothetical protein Q6281_25470, partial [Klebsiella pneumoniae]|nr:hypothetical protein [Klebsiella pneumoniae]